MFNKNKKRDLKGRRPVDNLLDDFVPKWKKTFVYMKKTQVKTWQGAIVLAFVGGLAASAIWIVRFQDENFSASASPSATLSLRSGSSNSLVVNQDDNFSVDLMLNTNSSNVVAVNAILQYNTDNFQLVGNPDISASVFNNAGDNTCVAQAQSQDKQCNIFNAATAGKVSMVMAKPTPGVNTAAGKIATLNFKALKPVTANTTDIKLNFAAVGSYADSDVILDDGNGTDILQSVASFTIAVSAPTCTSFTYSDWAACQSNNTQTRIVATSTPTGCKGGTPVLTQSCTYTASTCTSFTYTGWGSCQRNNTQTRRVTASSPTGCTGGTPLLTQSCVYKKSSRR